MRLNPVQNLTQLAREGGTLPLGERKRVLRCSNPLAGSKLCALFLLGSGLAATLALAGCISKAKAQAQARAAFVAGQQQAMLNMQEFRARGPIVTVMGEVRNTVIPWTAELTLSKAVVAAEYVGPTDPTEIYLVRNGRATRYDPKQLLAGDDVPLEPKDVVQIKQ